MDDTKYYYCTVCGNVIVKVHDSGVMPMCCMREMEEMVPGSTDGKIESHVPVCEKHGKRVEVCVGSNPHPMERDHYIEWIEIVTDRGTQRRYLNPGDEPVAHFRMCDKEKLLGCYAYCNKHKLFRSECEESDDEEYDRYMDD